ncbi:MAG TPA: response regulator [Candidatus Baltobacteraceae bacterium]|jgi:CheY-like chemotaxis protein|nr:response regulator [Candidatus Baltobacteraceae bacterium]
MATVLIVDDDAATRLLVTTLLRHAGHTPIEATNGAEGLSSAAEHQPDLILLDLSMPSMSGPEFVRALRIAPQTRTTTVALYTASPMNAMLRDFMEMYGIEDVIPKPSEPSEFIDSVRQALRE